MTASPSTERTPALTPDCCVLEAPLDEDGATTLALQLKALADPTRLRLLSLIATSPSGELCACVLPAAVDKAQPTVSHHLSQLVQAGVIEREQRGKWAWFRLNAGCLAAIRATLGEHAERHDVGRPTVPFSGGGASPSAATDADGSARS